VATGGRAIYLSRAIERHVTGRRGDLQRDKVVMRASLATRNVAIYVGEKRRFKTIASGVAQTRRVFHQHSAYTALSVKLHLRDGRTDAGNGIWCILAVKCDTWWQ